MREILAAALLMSLPACGVDGPPQRPEPREAPPPGISIRGSAEAGVAGTTGLRDRGLSRVGPEIVP
jgi:predicted small lipoprotein YifL